MPREDSNLKGGRVQQGLLHNLMMAQLTPPHPAIETLQGGVGHIFTISAQIAHHFVSLSVSLCKGMRLIIARK